MQSFVVALDISIIDGCATMYLRNGVGGGGFPMGYMLSTPGCLAGVRNDKGEWGVSREEVGTFPLPRIRMHYVHRTQCSFREM